MELKLIATLIVVNCGWLQAQERASEGEERRLQNLYQSLDIIQYPRVSKQQVRSGTCFLAITEETGVKILNPLGDDYSQMIMAGIDPNVLDLFTTDTYIAITFVAGDMEYARVQKPKSIGREVIIEGLPDYRSRASKEKLSSNFAKQYRQGNYSKALKVLDDLILLDPYRINYRTERIKIYNLLGAPSMACDDFIILREILNYHGVATNPCGINGSD